MTIYMTIYMTLHVMCRASRAISLDAMDISGEQHLDVSHEVHKHSLSWTPSIVSGGVGSPHTEEGSY